MEHWEDGSPNPEGKIIRSNMKGVILGIIYGRGAASIAAETGQTLEEARKTIDSFYGAYPIVKQWMDTTIADAKKNGYVSTICGRRRRLPDIQLPEFTIEEDKTKLTNNILFEDIKTSNNVDKINLYKTKLNSAKNKYEIDNIIKLAKQDNITIKNNKGWIAKATRQSVNARVQGGAADLSKTAMIDIYNSKEFRDLGFKMLYVIHDEIAGQCPKENANKVAQLLKNTMINSAKKLCSVPMKVDTYTLKHWYADDLSDTVQKAYNKLLKDHSKEEAFKLIDKDYPEIDLDILKQMCEGTIDLTDNRFAR